MSVHERRWHLPRVSFEAPPLIPTLRGYQRDWLLPDALAALMLLVIAVPEQLATSRLAGMPPITGYYAFIAGSVMIAVFGASGFLSVGADSTIAPLFAVGIAGFAVPGSIHYQQLVAVLAVMVGLLVAIVWLLRLGWIAAFLSAPIITGFLAGIAVIIVVHQLPDLLGISIAGGSTLGRLSSIVGHLGSVNAWALAIGLGTLAVILIAERIDRRLPGALFALVASTALVSAADLAAHGVKVLGTVQNAAPRLGLSALSFHTIGQLFPLAAVVALVVVTQSAATARAFSDSVAIEDEVGRDLLGVGAGGVLAGLTGAFPINASPARSAVLASAPARSQAAGLLAAVAVALLVPAAGALSNVPLAALAGVLLYVASRIFHYRDLVAIFHFDAFEFGLALITLLTVALIGVEQGIGVAVGLAILDRTRLDSRPQLHVLGRIPGSTSWAPVSGHTGAEQVEGALVVLFATPLWYANAGRFRAELDGARARALGRTRVVVLDALGMSDIDYTGTLALSHALDALKRDGIAFAIARAGANARKNLDRSGLAARIGEDRFFASVDEAIVGSRDRDASAATT